MTDKVQEIKEWISKEKDGLMDAQGNFEYPEHEGAYHILCNLDAYIDSLQEEPKFKTGDRINPIDSCLGSPRTIVDVCDSWYVTDKGTLDFEYEDNWELVEEPASEDEIEKQFKVGDIVVYMSRHPAYSGLYLLGNPNDLSIGYSNANEPYQIALRNCTVASEDERRQFMRELNDNGYKWNEVTLKIDKKEEPVNKDFEMALTEMVDKAQKCVVEPWAIAAQWKDELIKLAKSEEPVSGEWIEELRTKLDSMSKEDFKKVFDKYAINSNEVPVSEIDFEQELYKAFGQVKDFTLGMRIAKRFYEMGRNHQEPVREDLEGACEQLAENARKYKAETSSPFFSQTDYKQGVIDGAKWQEDQLEKNRLAACDRQTQEEAKIERDFVMSIIEKEHRQPTFDDAIKYGMRLQRENMMKKATEVTVHIDSGNYPYIPQIELCDYDKDIPLAKEGDKYKVILIKED